MHKDRLVLFIYGAHKSGCGRKNLVDKDEYSFLWCQLDALPDDVDELSHSQILVNRQQSDIHRAWCAARSTLTEGTRYFFLSIVGISVRSAFSQIT